MSTVEGEGALISVAASAPKVRRRRLRAILLAALTAQYTIVAIVVSLSVAGTLRYLDAADRRKVRSDRRGAEALTSRPVRMHLTILPLDLSISCDTEHA